MNHHFQPQTLTLSLSVNSKPNSKNWRCGLRNTVRVVQAVLALIGLATANSPAQAHAILHHFNGADGATPVDGLVLTGGMLLGTTYGPGEIFKLNTNGRDFGVLLNVYHFHSVWQWGKRLHQEQTQAMQHFEGVSDRGNVLV